MITTILKSNRSAILAVDYSEKKVFEGTAGVVCVRNMANSNLDTVYGVFEKIESNPAISERTRQFCFHMAVSPSETDELRDSEEKVVGYIDEMMRRLGYGQQPYIIYRHNDIEREHFHVVSSRIAPDGRPVRKENNIIAGRFEGRTVLKIMKELSSEYGFTIGNEQERLLTGEMSEAEWERVLATDKNKVEKIRQAFESALKYNYTSFAQFRTVMATLGVAVKSQKRRGVDNLWFAVEDEHGRIASRGFNAEFMLRTNAFERYDEARMRNAAADGAVDRRELAKMQAVLEYAAQKAHTRCEFRKMCSECGIDFVPQEKGGHLLTYSLVDKAHATVLTPVRLGRNVSAASLDALPIPEGARVDELLLRQDDFDAIRRRVAQLLGMALEKEKTKRETEKVRIGGGAGRH